MGPSFVGSVMKIAKIEVFQVDLPYAGGVYVLSGGREYRSFDATFVRVTTDYGLQGWGESTPFGPNYIAAHALGVRSGIEEIAPMLIDADALAVDRANDLMDQALMGHLHAKTAIDLALWDILGKATNLPCYQLLGEVMTCQCPGSAAYMQDPQTICVGASRITARVDIAAIV